MGGKDLNLKKSWHVNLMSNQKKVWQAEQSALDERKKIEQLRREREEERAMEEIAKLQEAAGGRTKANRVDWMYQGGASGSAGVTEEQESYLLGKRRVDQLILKKDQEAREALKKGAANGIAGLGAEVSLNGRDLATKTALDPLMAIEQQKQRAMEEQIERLQRMQKIKSSREKKRSSRHDDSEHRRRRRYDDDSGDDRKRSRRTDGSRERRRRDESRDRRRQRSRTPEIRYRSRTPERRRRSRTPDKRRHRDDSRERVRRRSRSPESKHRHRNESADRTRRRDSSRDRGSRYESARREKRRNSSSDREPSRPATHKEDNDDRAARLAAMQSNAQDMEKDRSKRLAEMADRELREKEIEDAKRLTKSGNYATGLRREMLQNV